MARAMGHIAMNAWRKTLPGRLAFHSHPLQQALQTREEESLQTSPDTLRVGKKSAVPVPAGMATGADERKEAPAVSTAMLVLAVVIETHHLVMYC